MTARDELETLLFEHVAPDEPEIADVFLDEVGNVVITHEQHVERHVLAEGHELIPAARDPRTDGTHPDPQHFSNLLI